MTSTKGRVCAASCSGPVRTRKAGGEVATASTPELTRAFIVPVPQRGYRAVVYTRNEHAIENKPGAMEFPHSFTQGFGSIKGTPVSYRSGKLTRLARHQWQHNSTITACSPSPVPLVPLPMQHSSSLTIALGVVLSLCAGESAHFLLKSHCLDALSRDKLRPLKLLWAMRCMQILPKSALALTKVLFLCARHQIRHMRCQCWGQGPSHLRRSAAVGR